QSPVTSVKEAEDSLEISYTTANDLINSLVEMNILEEMTGNSRNRVFIFRRYVDTFGEQGINP
ncbi:MAG: Fic family protein, partial [Candidatus Cloacimonetes bacterium]|nr:Fic family protein [Candidatus Cloacimonadota bacterium]MCK9185634.1 Fic family protein [Candidatus Cloacimonadota bacterium]